MGAFVVDSKRFLEILSASLLSLVEHGKRTRRRLRKVEWRREKMGKKEREEKEGKGRALFATAASRYVGGIGGQGI